MKDLSIEYAHIYTNDKIGKEQKVSLEVLKNITDNANNSKQSVSLVILVDDYSFPDPTFDYESFSAWLGDNGFKPDIIFRESQLIPLCDEVLRHLQDTKLKEQLNDYIKSKKYPCSLFIAAWYLLRLGFLEYPMFPKELQAKELINILPESFKPFEDKGIEIMSKTNFGNPEKSVKYRYIEGRLLA